ncbi:MAG TPA: 2-hydroxychromene-2-carboxylate isomerase [Terriglobales bacterium]|nr:2-hydroxychromene-2-carboxylate isomerase [Terriglobales bacterium]
MSASVIQFWFEFASTYSYLSAMRLEAATSAAGVVIEWHPFLLGPIFRAQGWNDSPFNIYPAKGRYMWRDMERLCQRYGLPLRRPSQFPRNGLLAARLATLAAGEPWVGDFVRAIYTANFAQDLDIGSPEVVSAILTAMGKPAAEILAAAQQDDNKTQLRLQTEEAQALGIFGAPSFIANGELFWGDDRLEQALEAAKQ